MANKHKEIICYVKGCNEEATYWIPFGNTTQYFCVDHVAQLSGEEIDCYTTFDPISKTIKAVEIGGYSCSEECVVCN